MWHATLRHRSTSHASSVKCAESAPRSIARTGGLAIPPSSREAEINERSLRQHCNSDDPSLGLTNRVLRSALALTRQISRLRRIFRNLTAGRVSSLGRGTLNRGSPRAREKVKNVSSFVPAILTVTRWERLLIARPREATHDADRC
jgi:hypothetical protein